MWMEVEEELESSFVVKEFFREDINLQPVTESSGRIVKLINADTSTANTFS
jgi:hypothetical protein